MRFRRFRQEDLWQLMRRRILHETSSFLSEALERPEMAVSIPMVVVGKGGFTKSFADEFWRQVLSE